MGIDQFYPHPRMPNGLNICKTCTKNRIKKYRQDNSSVQEYDRRRYQDNPLRKQRIIESHRQNSARTKVVKNCSQIVYRAIAKGILTKLDYCENCGATSYIEAAHYDYSKPLEVKWLCRSCHRRWDTLDPKFKEK